MRSSATTTMLSESAEFAKASSLVAWNRRLLRAIGLWPAARFDLLFVILCSYFIYHLLLCYVTLYKVLNHFLLFTKVMVEILTYSHIAFRFVQLRRHGTVFGELFEEMRRDFAPTMYVYQEEKRAFLKYNVLGKSMVKILLTFPTATSMLYYMKPLLLRHLALRAVRLSGKNVTIPYMMPFGFYKVHKITTTRVYALTYASQFPFAVLVGLVQSSTDCLVLTLGSHLCGRLAALSERIKRMRVDDGDERRQFRTVVRIHQHLLRIGKKMEQSLSSLMFFHLLVAATLICIVIFQILINMVPGKRVNLINIFVLLSVNILRLYTHCWIGEYLIQESNSVTEAFYECEWYNMQLKHRKLILLNLLRSQTPLRFVAGGFGTFSINVFTEVMKTAMAYLSFLRNFI